jgi:glycosyltransferase involved in cell wall biosynthesis
MGVRLQPRALIRSRSPQQAPLRIAHLIESDGPGGAERVVVHLATTLQAQGLTNVVFLPRHGEGWLEHQLRGSGIAIEYFTIERPFSPACARHVANALSVHGTNVAHSHEFSMAVYGSWASWLAGVPHIITMHGSAYYAGRLRRRLAMRMAVAASRHAVAVSNPLADHMSRTLGVRRSQIGVIANGVRHEPLGETSTLRDELRLSSQDRLVVAVGNLYPVKGHRHLIDALGLLSARHPTLHVAIGGRGALAEPLANQARELGLGDRLHLLGLRSDVPAMFAAADIVALPSLSEGLPMALLEAMFARRPIIASAVGEIPHTLEHGRAGLLVAPGDPAALAKEIDRLLTDVTLAQRLAERAFARALDEYDVSQMVKRYLALYTGTCAAAQIERRPAAHVSPSATNIIQ